MLIHFIIINEINILNIFFGIRIFLWLEKKIRFFNDDFWYGCYFLFLRLLGWRWGYDLYNFFCRLFGLFQLNDRLLLYIGLYSGMYNGLLSFRITFRLGLFGETFLIFNLNILLSFLLYQFCLDDVCIGNNLNIIFIKMLLSSKLNRGIFCFKTI